MFENETWIQKYFLVTCKWLKHEILTSTQNLRQKDSFKENFSSIFVLKTRFCIVQYVLYNYVSRNRFQFKSVGTEFVRNWNCWIITISTNNYLSDFYFIFFHQPCQFFLFQFYFKIAFDLSSWLSTDLIFGDLYYYPKSVPIFVT